MGIFKRSGGPSQPQEHQSSPQEDPLRQGESLGASFSYEHPHWASDRVTMGTHPESTRIAMSRQFARVIGDTLGKHTASPEESVRCLQEALADPVYLPTFQKHLYGAVETVSTSKGYDDSTKNLVAYIDSALRNASLVEKLSTTAALMRETVTKTFDDMLSGPTDPRNMMSLSGDQSMYTVFGVRGEVERMAITMVRGQLSHLFKKTLESAQTRYDSKKDALQAGQAIPYDKVFSLKLSIGDDVSTFKTTRDDLIKSYNEALTLYSSISYANRVRARAQAAPALEERNLEPRGRDGV